MVKTLNVLNKIMICYQARELNVGSKASNIICQKIYIFDGLRVATDRYITELQQPWKCVVRHCMPAQFAITQKNVLFHWISNSIPT